MCSLKATRIASSAATRAKRLYILARSAFLSSATCNANKQQIGRCFYGHGHQTSGSCMRMSPVKSSVDSRRTIRHDAIFNEAMLSDHSTSLSIAGIFL